MSYPVPATFRPLPDALVGGFLGGGYQPRTRKRYEAALARWAEWCREHDLVMLDARRTDIEAFALQLEGRGMAANTRRATLTAVTGLYRFAFEERWIPADPGAGVRRPARVRASSAVWLTADEARRMGETAMRDPDPRTDALFSLFLLTGIRACEGLGADVTDLSDYGDARTLTVTRKGVGGEIYAQRLRLADRTCRALDRMLGARGSGPLFLSERRRRLDDDAANRLLKRLARDAGVDKNVTMHSLRYTFATLCLDAGVPERDIMASANWRSTAMLRQYDQQRAGVDRHAGLALDAWLSGDGGDRGSMAS